MAASLAELVLVATQFDCVDSIIIDGGLDRIIRDLQNGTITPTDELIDYYRDVFYNDISLNGTALDLVITYTDCSIEVERFIVQNYINGFCRGCRTFLNGCTDECN